MLASQLHGQSWKTIVQKKKIALRLVGVKLSNDLDLDEKME